MILSNSKILGTATAITVISFVMQGVDLNQSVQTKDVYEMPINKFAPQAMNASQGLPTFVSEPQNTFSTWHLVPQKSDLSIAFNSCGVNEGLGTHLLGMAKGILAEMNYSNVKVKPTLVRDPEEDATYLTVRLYVNATFEESLELDSKLTSELIHRTDRLPQNLSFAVYDIG
jgi:hypothetical protein